MSSVTEETAIDPEDKIIAITQAPSDHAGYIVNSSVPPTDSADVELLKQTHSVHLPQSLIDRYLTQKLPSYLKLLEEHIHVIISVKSGREKALTYFDEVVKPVLSTLGLDEKCYHIIRTKSQETVKQFASTTLKDKAESGLGQTVLLFSGDGGIVEIINGLLEGTPPSSNYIRPTIILFPLGTGNALFHSLHRLSYPSPIPSDLTLAFRTLLNGSPHSLPIFRATFSSGSRLLTEEGHTASPIPSNTVYGAIVASYGLHATLVADSDTSEWRKYGDERFKLVAKELLSPSDGDPPHAYKARITLNKPSSRQTTNLNTETGHVLPREEHGYVLASLVSNLEKTFTISPASIPLDDKLRLVHFGPQPAQDVLRIMKLAYDGGKHVEEAKEIVEYEEIERLRIDFLEPGEDGRWRRVCIDGLIVRIEEGGWMEAEKVRPGGEAIDVVI